MKLAAPAAVAPPHVGVVLPTPRRRGSGAAIEPSLGWHAKHRPRASTILAALALALAACAGANVVVREYVETEAPHVPTIDIA